MATPVSEAIPDLNLSPEVLALDSQVGYDEVNSLREFASRELYGTLHFRQVSLQDRRSGFGGFIRFASSGNIDTERTQPETMYSLRLMHNYSPEAWLMSFGVKKVLDARLGSYEQRIYRVDTMNREVWQAFSCTRTFSKSSELGFDANNKPSEQIEIERTCDFESLTTEGCVDLLVLMDRVARRARIDQPSRRIDVRKSSRSLDIDDYNL